MQNAVKNKQSKKKKLASEHQFCRRRRRVDERGQRRMNRQVRADMKDIVTTLYKRGELKSISECVADLDGGMG